MKTILIAHNYTQETVAAMSYNLAHYLANNNYKVIFISHQPFFEKKFIDDKVIVYSWPTKGRPTSFKDAIWFAKLYLRYRPSVIISHFGSVNITVIVSKILSLWKVKALPYYHSISAALEMDNNLTSLISRLKKKRKYLIYKIFCNQIICPSEISRLDLATYFKINKGVKVLNPMTDRFHEITPNYTNEVVLSYLGRINRSKGVFLLLEAFELYCNKNKTSKIRLKIAGSGSEELEFNEIIKKSNNSKITYVGGIKYYQIDAFLRKGSFTIIPSFFDNLPTVGLESLMNGVPLLISKNTGLTQELEENVSCIPFDPTLNDFLHLFNRLENSQYDYSTLKLNARQVYLQKFDINSYCSAIQALIENN